MHTTFDDRVIQRYRPTVACAGIDTQSDGVQVQMMTVPTGPHVQVLAQCQEVVFRDGSAVHLHLLRLDNQAAPDTFCRGLQVEGLSWFAVDLRRTLGLARSVEFQRDVLRLLPADTPGMVFYSLRAAFASAEHFVATARACAFATWWPQAEQAAA